MKVRVNKDFADKNKPWITYKVGTTIDVDDKRAEDMIARGLVSAPVTAKAKEEKPVPKTGKKETKNVRKGKTCVKNND